MTPMPPGAKKIPNNIVLFWHDKSAIPERIRQAVEKTIAANPGATVVFADDAYMRAFIQSNYGGDASELYDLIRVPASRSDLARLMLLYEHGGVYLDAAMETLRPVHSILGDDADLVFVRRDDLARYAHCRDKAHVINGIIGAVARCTLIEEAISMIMDNLRTRRYDHCWYATGAHSLNVLLAKYQRLYRIETLSFSQLLRDFFVYRRVHGISNAWVAQQRDGILSPRADGGAHLESRGGG
jgi:hypothetical protein